MNALQYQLENVPMLGKGMLLIDPLDVNGNLTGAIAIGNATKFGLDTKDDRAELYSSMNASASLLATALKKRTITASFTGTDFKSDVAALALMSAGKSTLAISAATITDEVLASASATKAGRYFQTANRNIDPATGYSGVSLATGALGATALDYGTDFVVADPVQGLIYIPAGSAADADYPLVIGYKTLLATFDQVEGATMPTIKAKLTFSPDPTDGQKIGLEVWTVNLSPSGTIELIADDYGNWQLEGLVLDDTVNHPTAPLYLATFYP
jgi:hypothetical protein